MDWDLPTGIEDTTGRVLVHRWLIWLLLLQIKVQGCYSTVSEFEIKFSFLLYYYYYHEMPALGRSSTGD